MNSVNSKVKIKFYNQKLKQKAVDSLKLYFQRAVETESRVIDFMDKREKKKYFQKIILFNEAERKKVHSFRLEKAFKALTDRIVGNYCQKMHIADNFRAINLQYKVLFGLKN